MAVSENCFNLLCQQTPPATRAQKGHLMQVPPSKLGRFLNPSIHVRRLCCSLVLSQPWPLNRPLQPNKEYEKG